jgi:hypothetical protein
MPANAINSMNSGVSILFADPAQPLPSESTLRKTDAICVDLDRCSREEDGSLGEVCTAFLVDATKRDVDVILAANAVRFYEIPGLDNFAVTFIEKPTTELTGESLAAWVAEEIGQAMGLNRGVKRGFRSIKSVGSNEPGKVAAVHLESNLSKEHEEAFLDFVSGHSEKREVISASPSPQKKKVTARPVKAVYPGKRAMPSASGRVLYGEGAKSGVYAEKAGILVDRAKISKTRSSKSDVAPKTMAADVSSAGSRRKV